ncbi:MAG: Sua5/YciO/YrdC/YwlC family protein [Limisphaerales bacterium]|nr:MAG: Sua5/YciO/YrdC/YwlC family protein [Limisphaerales bacterium]
MSGSASLEVLSTHTPALFAAAAGRAAELLRAGEVVALPTETVYGLAANALDRQAVAKIYELKGRPAHNPIIVHVDGLDMARRCVREWPAAAERLAGAFWPGPLTIVLPRAAGIPDLVTAGGDTVGVRWPQHPLMREVIRACGFPLAAPSANLSNQLSPTNVEHVRKQLGDRLRLIVDGGDSNVGIESTVVDLTVNPPRVLRPGMIHAESLAAALGDGRLPIGDGRLEHGESALRSPGQLPKHYSPKARLVVLAWRDEAELKARLAGLGVAPASAWVLAHSHIPLGGGFGSVSVIPHDAEAYARALYAELHHCDEEGAACIVAEAPPDTPEWRGIADRLRRAAA